MRWSLNPTQDAFLLFCQKSSLTKGPRPLQIGLDTLPQGTQKKDFLQYLKKYALKHLLYASQSNNETPRILILPLLSKRFDIPKRTLLGLECLEGLSLGGQH